MKYKIDFKELLKECNWQHPDFGIVARFFGGKDWEETIFDENVIKNYES